MFQVWVGNKASNDLEEEEAFKLYDTLVIKFPSSKIKLVEEICYEGYSILKSSTKSNPFKKSKVWLGIPRI